MNAIKSSHTTTASILLVALFVINSNSWIPDMTGKKGEILQLDKMAKLVMYDKLCKDPCKAIILCPR